MAQRATYKGEEKEALLLGDDESRLLRLFSQLTAENQAVALESAVKILADQQASVCSLGSAGE